MILQVELHVDVGAGVGRGDDALGRNVAKADGFVEVDGGGERVIGFEVEAMGAGGTGLGDGVLE